MKTSRISRMVKLLTTLQSNEPMAPDELAQLFGTSRRTVFRDLKELGQIGVPYEFDAKSGGYSIDPQFFLPPVDLNIQEALSLLILVHKARNQVQLPFKNSAMIAAMKIENNLPSNIRNYCRDVLGQVSIKEQAIADCGGLDKHFGILKDAILKTRRLKMDYDSLFDKGTITTELSPYHIFFNRRAWYVIGHSGFHNQVRTFKLNRIAALEQMDKCFIDGEHFDIQEYLGRAWSMIPEGQIYDIKLLFKPKVAANVAEVKWHSTQKCTFNKDGSAIIEFRVDGLGEITWWILGYGDQVEILSPSKLREKIAVIGQNIAAVNSSRPCAVASGI